MINSASSTDTLDRPQRQALHTVEEPSYLFDFQRGDGPIAIFCFLFMGGFNREFTSYAGLAPMVGRQYSFYGIIARGTDGKLEPHHSVEEMAAAYIRQMKAIQPHGPYYLLGECFSASVAYETAQQLRARGDRVAMLAFLDARVPGTLMNRILGNRLTARVRCRIAIITHSSAYKRLQAIVNRLQMLRNNHPVVWPAYVVRRLIVHTPRRSSADSPGGESPLFRRTKELERAVRKYRLAVRRYERRPYSGRITIIASSEFHESSPKMGWERVGDLQIHRVPGAHDSYLKESRQLVVRLLQDLIENARLNSN